MNVVPQTPEQQYVDPTETTLRPSTAPPSVGSYEHLNVATYGSTEVGLVRDRNEDQFVIATLTGLMWIDQSSFPQPRLQCGGPRGHLMVVADGMGGHVAGDRASTLAVGTIENFVLGALGWLLDLSSPGDTLLDELKTALRRADATVTAAAAAQPEFRAMGTTLTLAYAYEDILYVAHAGDSRCYLSRNGVLSQITRDHTIVGELVAAGILEPELARENQLRHLVTNVVGGGTPKVSVELHKLSLEPNDVVILCTDGLTEMVTDDAIQAVIDENVQPDAITHRLIFDAVKNGGVDNVTVVAARFTEAAPPSLH
jgi:protein phosphatase